MRVSKTDNLDTTKIASPDREQQYKGWEKIGYHRVLGGFLYNIIFAVFAVGFAFVLPLIVPYAESLGYYNILTGIFSSIFTFADLGLASALSRFVAEYRVKNPKRTIQYVRFFIWFQAFTGLIQTTAVSMVGLWGLGNSNLEFMPWLFVWLSIVQYPGWLGVFTEALKGFQQYGKVALAGFLNTMVFQLITLALGAQLGAYWGNQNPQIGGTLGCAIGLVIGYYVDDFTSVIITAWMFSKVLEPMGFQIRDAFYPKFSKEIAVESIKFGLGVMLFVLSYQSIGTIVAFIYANSLPNYSSYIGTLSIITPFIGLAESVNTVHIGNHRSAVSEAFFNDKPNYAVYILSNGFRTIGQITFLILPLTILMSPLIITELFPDYATIFGLVFVPKLIHSTIFQHSHLMNEVLIGTGNHKFNVFITVFEQIVSLITVIVCIQLELGVFVLIIPGYTQTFVKQGAGWWYINKKIINLRINAWQNWVAPFFAGTIYFFLFFGLRSAFKTIFTNQIYTIVLIIVLGIYILPGLGYFFPIALFGGYDEHTLKDLERAVELSGPSKFLVKYWYKGARWGSEICPWFGKYPLDYSGVGKEIDELMKMKKESDKSTQKMLKA